MYLRAIYSRISYVRILPQCRHITSYLKSPIDSLWTLFVAFLRFVLYFLICNVVKDILCDITYHKKALPCIAFCCQLYMQYLRSYLFIFFYTSAPRLMYTSIVFRIVTPVHNSKYAPPKKTFLFCLNMLRCIEKLVFYLYTYFLQASL